MFAGSDEVLMINPTTYFLMPENISKSFLKETLTSNPSQAENVFIMCLFNVIKLTFTLISWQNLPACFDDCLQNL